MKEVKEKTCINCGNPFIPKRRTTERVCSMSCAIDVAKGKTKKTKEKAKKTEMKKWNKRKKETLEKLKPKSHFEKQLEAVINAIAREIDFGQPCISCGGNGKPQAGHYHSVNANPSIRFNLHNINLQCYRCNVQYSANIQKYDLGLINTYGKEYWEYVKFSIVADHPILKLSIDEIKEFTKEARKVLKDIRRIPRTKKERIKLRELVNTRIGIYP